MNTPLVSVLLSSHTHTHTHTHTRTPFCSAAAAMLSTSLLRAARPAATASRFAALRFGMSRPRPIPARGGLRRSAAGAAGAIRAQTVLTDPAGAAEEKGGGLVLCFVLSPLFLLLLLMVTTTMCDGHSVVAVKQLEKRRRAQRQNAAAMEERRKGGQQQRRKGGRLQTLRCEIKKPRLKRGGGCGWLGLR